MNCYEIISSIIASLAVLVSSIAAFFTYKNLKEIRNQFFEQNLGSLVFYISKTKPGITHSLVLKNFGNSPAKLISLGIQPRLVWSKTNIDIPNKFDVTNCKNVFLAQNQYIVSEFDFSKYPDEVFQISLEYETCGKTIKTDYSIDLRFSHYLVETKQIPQGNDTTVLKAINNSIQQLSDRFL